MKKPMGLSGKPIHVQVVKHFRIRCLSEHAQFVVIFYTEGRHMLSILGSKWLGIPLGKLNSSYKVLAENREKDTSLLLKAPALPGKQHVHQS